jgi:two-component system chemotaxis response regulator CheB
MTSVLVVDDSRPVRKLVGSVLTEHGYEVGTASSAREGVELVQTLDPDVVTMDVRMPGMDGIEAVERIMATNPTPVVMLSAYTTGGGDATIQALARGAVDFLHKPGSETDVDVEDLKSDLVETVDAVAGAPVDRLAANVRSIDDREPGEDSNARPFADPEADIDAVTGLPGRLPLDMRSRTPSPDRPEVATQPATPPTVVIGASTGGPNVLDGVVTGLPAALNARVLVVQHMPPSFTGRLASHLDDVGGYDVAEARDGATVGAGEMLVAKGDYHMRVSGFAGGAGPNGRRLQVSLDQDERIHSVRPAVDATMASVARREFAPLVGVVLTGMGEDGAAGIESMHAVGATTIAQNEETSPVFSMPRHAIETGCIDNVLAAEAIPAAIVDAVEKREREEAHA